MNPVQYDVYQSLHPSEWRTLLEVINHLNKWREHDSKKPYDAATVWGRLDELVNSGWAKMNYDLSKGKKISASHDLSYLQVPGYQGGEKEKVPQGRWVPEFA